MIYFTKIENDLLIIKLIDNNNTHSFFISIKINKDTLHLFRDFYHNIHKNISSNITLDNVNFIFNDNMIKFENNNFKVKINKTNEIMEMFDKIITNIMIYDMDLDSPKRGESTDLF